jgi:predicted RNA binding protein YcfA (HicA-like mRNA interferase family)
VNPRLPAVTWQQVTKALERAGFVFDRQKGSHLVYYHPQTNHTVVVPKHREVKIGTLREILREADLSHNDFLNLLR